MATKEENPGYVYILTNPSFREDWVKIGMTQNMEERLRTLDNTALPLPFKKYATLQTVKYQKAEKHVHHSIERFTNLRIRDNREFFNVKPEKALEIFCEVAELLDDAVVAIYNEEGTPQIIYPSTCPKKIIKPHTSNANTLVPKEGDKIFCVKVGKVPRENLYEQTRKHWKVRFDRVSQATHVFAVIGGIVEAVYIPQVWKRSTGSRVGRCEFEGVEDVNSEYLGKSVVDFYGKSQNPCLYINM